MNQLVSTVLMIALAVIAFGVLYLITMDTVGTSVALITTGPRCSIQANQVGSSIYFSHRGGDTLDHYTIKQNSVDVVSGTNFSIGSVVDVTINESSQVTLTSDNCVLFSGWFVLSEPIVEPQHIDITCSSDVDELTNFTVVTSTECVVLFCGSNYSTDNCSVNVTAPEVNQTSQFVVVANASGFENGTFTVTIHDIEVVSTVTIIVDEFNLDCVGVDVLSAVLQCDDEYVTAHNNGTAYLRYECSDVTTVELVCLTHHAQAVGSTGLLTVYVNTHGQWFSQDVLVTSYAPYEVVWFVNPATAEPWTVQEVNDCVYQTTIVVGSNVEIDCIEFESH